MITETVIIHGEMKEYQKSTGVARGVTGRNFSVAAPGEEVGTPEHTFNAVRWSIPDEPSSFGIQRFLLIIFIPIYSAQRNGGRTLEILFLLPPADTHLHVHQNATELGRPALTRMRQCCLQNPDNSDPISSKSEAEVLIIAL
jgi:hypothetical protein